MEQREPKILLYDLEVSRDVVEGYGNKYEFRVVKTIRHQELMCYAYKWLGTNKTVFVSRHDFKTYKEFVESLWEVLNEADIVIAHNANKFDNKMSNRFFVKENLRPVSPYRSIDTLQVARSNFKFQSNGLNDLGEYLGLGKKEKITYADLEEDFMSDNPSRKTVSAMKKYNIQDITLLEAIYLRLLPYIKNHPNISVISQRVDTCPRCGGNHLQARGQAISNTAIYKRFQCIDCGGWTRLRLQDKEDGQLKSTYVNL